MNKTAICITACEQSENHVGMKINGNGLSQNGFTIEELEKIQETLRENKIEFEYYRLDSVLENKEGVEPAGLLMIPNGIKQLTGENPDDLLKEQLSFKWDTPW
jgi:thermostable 8-oxoguanine DNA glycosylase